MARPVDRRALASLAVVAVFTLALAGTSKAPVPPVAAPPGKAPPLTSAGLPSTSPWNATDVPELGVRLRIPDGWKIEGAGRGPAGPWIRISTDGGPTLHVFDGTKTPIDFDDVARSIDADVQSGEVDLLVRDTSVVVAQGRSARRTGCFASACSLGAPRLCVNGAGFPDDAGRGLREAECLEVAAMIHSIELGSVSRPP